MFWYENTSNNSHGKDGDGEDPRAEIEFSSFLVLRQLGRRARERGLRLRLKWVGRVREATIRRRILSFGRAPVCHSQSKHGPLSYVSLRTMVFVDRGTHGKSFSGCREC